MQGVSSVFRAVRFPKRRHAYLLGAFLIKRTPPPFVGVFFPVGEPTSGVASKPLFFAFEFRSTARPKKGSLLPLSVSRNFHCGGWPETHLAVTTFSGNPFWVGSQGTTNWESPTSRLPEKETSALVSSKITGFFPPAWQWKKTGFRLATCMAQGLGKLACVFLLAFCSPLGFLLNPDKLARTNSKIGQVTHFPAPARWHVALTPGPAGSVDAT